MTVKDRVAVLEKQAAQHDRQIKSTRDLVREGMRLVVENRRDLRALTVAHRRTEASLKAFIDSLRRPGNGKSTGQV
jgi:hypothetical protein